MGVQTKNSRLYYISSIISYRPTLSQNGGAARYCNA